MTLAIVGMLSACVAGDDKTASPADPLQPKAVFKGTREFTKGAAAGNTVEAELRITKRGDEKFSGLAIFRGQNSFDIKGTLKDGKVEWSEKRRSGNAFPTAVKGFLKDDKLVLTFTGTNPADGTIVEGNMTLELQEK